MAVPAATHMRPFAIGFADRALVEPYGVDGAVLRDRNGGSLRSSIRGTGGDTLRCMERRRTTDEEHGRSGDGKEAAAATFQRATMFSLHHAIHGGKKRGGHSLQQPSTTRKLRSTQSLSFVGHHQPAATLSDAPTLPASRPVNR